MKKLVLFYDKLILLPDDFLNLYDLYSFESNKLNNNILKNHKCDILLSRSTLKVNKELLDGIDLKYYATATAGFDHVDLNYLNNRHIKYYIASGSNSNSVAEYVMINIYNWIKSNNFNPNEKTIGIVGFGNIGKKVAYYSNIYGLNVIINDAPLYDQKYKFPTYVTHNNLNELISQSDILTNHLPLIKEGRYKTLGILGENLLKLKNNSLLLHTSRAGIINENFLVESKNSNLLDLIIDVWENEPNIDDKLVNLTNIATPHIAGHSYNAKINASNQILNNLYELGIVNKIFKIDISNNILTDKSNFFNKIETSVLERKVDIDSGEFKKNIKEFKIFRNQYPKRLETLLSNI